MNVLGSFSGFTVDNITKAKEFYVDTLGIELTSEKMGLHLSLPGGTQVFVYEKPDHVPAEYTMLNLVVESIDSAVDDLSAKGIELERYGTFDNGAKQDEKGIMRGLAANMGPDIAWFKDPAGNILSVLQDA